MAAGFGSEEHDHISDLSDGHQPELDIYRPWKASARGGSRKSGRTAVQEQLQVLLHDAYERVRALPQTAVIAFAQSIGAAAASRPLLAARQIVAYIAGCKEKVVSRFYTEVKEGRLQKSHCSSSNTASEPPTEPKDDKAVLKVLVRSALAIGVDGRSLSSYSTEAHYRAKLGSFKGLGGAFCG